MAVTIDEIKEFDKDILFMDGFDDCIMGLCSRIGQPEIVAYDYDKVIKKLVSQGMTDEEADEFFSFNQLGAYMGPHTPCFIQKIGK